MQTVVIPTPELGNRSYVVSDAASAIVVDPQRDLERIEVVLEGLGRTVAYVLETHIHNDYVTGGHALALRTGADYCVHADDLVRFERRPVRGGDTLTAGAMRIEVIDTPGHTDTHLSYAIHSDGAPPLVFSGGALLYGTVGRTDLLGAGRARELAALQYRSVHRLAALPAETVLYPTHGFGSFCASGTGTGAELSTVGDEVEKNMALLATDEARFVGDLVAGFGAYPSYYELMAPLNRQGPAAADLDTDLAHVPPDELMRRIAAGELVSW